MRGYYKSKFEAQKIHLEWSHANTRHKAGRNAKLQARGAHWATYTKPVYTKPTYTKPAYAKPVYRRPGYHRPLYARHGADDAIKAEIEAAVAGHPCGCSKVQPNPNPDPNRGIAGHPGIYSKRVNSYRGNVRSPSIRVKRALAAMFVKIGHNRHKYSSKAAVEVRKKKREAVVMKELRLKLRIQTEQMESNRIQR